MVLREMESGRSLFGRSTIAAVLQRNGIEPVPERSRKRTWKEFQRETG
jgi:hypothetical protein